jgi:hypothetical protein
MRTRVWRRLAALLLLIPFSSFGATANVAADSYISAAKPTTNFGALGALDVGAGNAALIQVDLSSLPAPLAASNIQ